MPEQRVQIGAVGLVVVANGPDPSDQAGRSKLMTRWPLASSACFSRDPPEDHQSGQPMVLIHSYQSQLLFCSLDTIWLRGVCVLVFLLLGSRRIEYVACTSQPTTAWML